MPEGILILIAVAVAIVVMMATRAWGYKRRREEARAYQARMAVGDKVILSSGTHATIVELGKVTAVVSIAPGVNITVERYALSALERDLTGS